MMKALLQLRKAFGHSMKGLRETFRNESVQFFWY